MLVIMQNCWLLQKDMLKHRNLQKLLVTKFSVRVVTHSKSWIVQYVNCLKSKIFGYYWRKICHKHILCRFDIVPYRQNDRATHKCWKFLRIKNICPCCYQHFSAIPYQHRYLGQARHCIQKRFLHACASLGNPSSRICPATNFIRVRPCRYCPWRYQFQIKMTFSWNIRDIEKFKL